MHKGITILVLMITMLIITACDTGDTANQTTSAQNLQPNITGFERQEADNLVDGFIAAVGAGALGTGNVPLAATLERVSTTLECLQDTGSVSGLIYRQTQGVSIVPQAGVSIVVNKSRVERNIAGCLLETPFSAQSVLDIQPCADAGEFVFEGEEFYFGYIGAGVDFCNGIETHFSNLGAS